MDQPQILQARLPMTPWLNPRTAGLPGVNMLDWNDWLLVDDAYAAQMALKDRLLARHTSAVLADGAATAAAEHLALVLARLTNTPGYQVHDTHVRCPDGRFVPLDGSPLVCAARLVQQDICIMEKRGAEYVLAAAALCFPANWYLAEKIHRPMTAIHGPVAAYNDQIARVVGLMLDKMRPDRPLWRMNFLIYADARLHQPERLTEVTPDSGRYVRCERQSLVKLPQTGAIAFGIHTYVVAKDTLPADAFSALWDKMKDHYGQDHD